MDKEQLRRNTCPEIRIKAAAQLPESFEKFSSGFQVPHRRCSKYYSSSTEVFRPRLLVGMMVLWRPLLGNRPRPESTGPFMVAHQNTHSLGTGPAVAILVEEWMQVRLMS